MITKSSYLSFLKCKRLYFLNKDNKKKEITSNDRMIIERGNKIGKLARNYFDDYKLVDGLDNDLKISKTIEYYLDEDISNICEASFRYKDLYCQVDLLHKRSDGIDIYECKSSFSVDSLNIDDVSFQYYILTSLGYNVKNVYILTLNKNYIYQYKLDIKSYFKLNKINVKDDVEDNINKMKQLTTIPPVDCKKICKKCEFFNECFNSLPENNVFKIANFRKTCEYYNDGYISYEDVLERLKKSYEVKSKIPSTIKDAIEQIEFTIYNKEMKVEKNKIKDLLKDLKYPLYFLDFEAIIDDIAFINNTSSSFSRIFQFSVHIQPFQDSPLVHKEYLQEYLYDNIDEVIDMLISTLGSVGSIIVYSSYEKVHLEKLLELRKEKKKELTNIINRLFDLHEIFKNRYIYSKEMNGKSSIKVVYPLLCNEEVKNYDDLEDVHSGKDAILKYNELVNSSANYHEKIKQSMLEYCALDSYAMYMLLKKILLMIE